MSKPAHVFIREELEKGPRTRKELVKILEATKLFRDVESSCDGAIKSMKTWGSQGIKVLSDGQFALQKYEPLEEEIEKSLEENGFLLSSSGGGLDKNVPSVVAMDVKKSYTDKDFILAFNNVMKRKKLWWPPNEAPAGY